MQFIIKLFHIIHFLSTCSIAIGLFVLLLRMTVDSIHKKLNRPKIADILQTNVVNEEYENDKELNGDHHDDGDVHYPNISHAKSQNDRFTFVGLEKKFEKITRNELFSYFNDSIKIWSFYNKRLFRKQIIIGIGLFALYLLIATDNMLPSMLNILNVISFGKIILCLWMIYFIYPLYCIIPMSHHEIQVNIECNLRLGIISFILPLMFGIFIIGSTFILRTSTGLTI